MRVGIVIIGRNEGERLAECLNSAPANTPIVYVDSGSTDDSVSLAKAKGAVIVELDMSVPFTAARARNKGFEALIAAEPSLTYVQFIDGDCSLNADWIHIATSHLEQNPAHAVTCGRRRERFLENSVYNRLCDMEWDTPIGEVKACGGDALMRVDSFREVGGFNPDMIAGEEPELCVRFRKKGWKIWRLDQEMTLHDAAILHFGQWWRRTMRGGFAYALGASLHGKPPERHNVAQLRRAILWGVVIPLSILAVTIVDWRGLFLLSVYPFNIARIALRDSPSTRQSWDYAYFMSLGKFAEAMGVIRFYTLRLSKTPASLIEYK